MKYFTPELYTRLQSPAPEEAEAADAAWEQAVDHYEQSLEALRPALPESVGRLLDHYYLHDADVLGMGQQGDTFAITLQLAPPPRNLLFLTYTLTAAPAIETEVFPAEYRSPHAQWLCDEIDRPAGPPESFTHAILLSNGWHVRLTFRDLHAAEAQALLPLPTPVPAVPQPA
jgi:hypothetical protein